MESRILVIAAVSDELDGLARRLERPSSFKQPSRPEIVGRLAERNVRLLVTGPGLVNTARALAAAIETERPSLVIQTGCAGAFDAAAMAPGDIGIAQSEVDAQLGVEAVEGDRLVSSLPFPILVKESVCVKNRYPLDKRLVAMAAQVLKQDADATIGKIKVGPFVTVSTVTATDTRAKILQESHGAIMENMEGAAAAHVCLYYDIPFLEIRSVSNRVGRRDKRTWNLPLAFKRASQAVYTIIAHRPSTLLPK